MEIPSLTPIVLKRSPIRPAFCTPVFTCRMQQQRRVLSIHHTQRFSVFSGQSARWLIGTNQDQSKHTFSDRSRRCMLQGFPSHQMLDMPTWGSFNVSSVKPTQITSLGLGLGLGRLRERVELRGKERETVVRPCCLRVTHKLHTGESRLVLSCLRHFISCLVLSRLILSCRALSCCRYPHLLRTT
jgi:hypothetical protein